MNQEGTHHLFDQVPFGIDGRHPGAPRALPAAQDGDHSNRGAASSLQPWGCEPPEGGGEAAA